MAIKFGDTLENQNTAYPIVDVVGDNVAGVHIVDDFANDHLTTIPANARRTGSIVVAKDTGKAYIFIGTGGKITGNTNSSNEWGHAAGTNWIPAGSTTLGTPSDGDLTDGNPAVSSFTSDTLIVDAIDALNETLGGLVPTAPKSLATQINAGGEFAASEFAAFTSFNSNRVVSNPDNNLLSIDVPSTGAAVDHTTDTDISAQTITIEDSNDCAVEDVGIILAGSQSVFTVLDADDSTQTTSSLTLSKTTGGFPTGGDSAGFYTGISTLTYSYSGTLGSGLNKLSIGEGDGSPISTKTFYVQPTSSPAAISASNMVLDTSSMNEDTGFAYYYSSGVKYCGNTNFS